MAVNTQAGGTGKAVISDVVGDSSGPAAADLVHVGAGSEGSVLYLWIQVNTVYTGSPPTPAEFGSTPLPYFFSLTHGNKQGCANLKATSNSAGVLTDVQATAKLCAGNSANSKPMTATWVCNELQFAVPFASLHAGEIGGPPAPGIGTPIDFQAVADGAPGGPSYQRVGAVSAGDVGYKDGMWGGLTYTLGSPFTKFQNPPTGVTATPTGDNQVTISWTSPPDNGAQPISAYRVYRNGVYVGTVASPATSFVDSGLPAQNAATSPPSYMYTVSSVNCPALSNGGEGSPSAPSTAISPDFRPTAPTALSVGSPTSTSLTLTWTTASGDCPASTCTPAGSGATGVSGYAIYQGPAGGEGFLTNVAATTACTGTACTFTATGLNLGIESCFYAIAYDAYAAGPNTGASPPEACGTPSAPPAAPAAAADTFAVEANSLFSASACPAGTPSTVGEPYAGALCNDQDDADHDLIAVLVSGPTHTMPGGLFSWNADNKGGFAYRPATDYCGFTGDSFQYQLKDVTADSLLNTVTVQLNIACPPAAVGDAFSVSMNSLFTSAPCAANVPSAMGGPYRGVLCNDQDSANHAILALLVAAPVHTAGGGSFTWNADNRGGFSYQADTDYCGAAGDGFQYQMQDASANTLLNTVTVQLDIDCIVNQAPTATCTIGDAPPFAPDEWISFSAASSSDSDGSLAAWSWTFASATPASSTSSSPVAAWSLPGTYAVSLVVTDDDGASSDPAICSVTITNTAPTGAMDSYSAIAGGVLDTLLQGRPTVLANDSDDEGNLNSVQNPICTPLAAGTGTLDSFTFAGSDAGHFVYTPGPGFVGDTSFAYKPKDALGLLSTSCTIVSIHVQVNQPPTSAFSMHPSYGRVGEPVYFGDASREADQGDAVAGHEWTFGDGASSGASNPVHIYAVPGTYVVCLKASDSWGKSGETSCRAMSVGPATAASPGPAANPPATNPSPPLQEGSAPIAIDASADESVREGDLVHLSAAWTGPPGTSLSWIQTYGPRVELVGADASSATFEAPVLAGRLVVLYFEVSAKSSAQEARDGVLVVVQSATTSPTARTGSDAVASTGATAELDGRLSTSGNDQPLSFRWVQWEGPAVEIRGATSAVATFVVPDAPGATLRFALEVSDGHSSHLAIQTFIVAATQAPSDGREAMPTTDDSTLAGRPNGRPESTSDIGEATRSSGVRTWIWPLIAAVAAMGAAAVALYAWRRSAARREPPLFLKERP